VGRHDRPGHRRRRKTQRHRQRLGARGRQHDKQPTANANRIVPRGAESRPHQPLLRRLRRTLASLHEHDPVGARTVDARRHRSVEGHGRRAPVATDRVDEVARVSGQRGRPEGLAIRHARHEGAEHLRRQQGR
jgi:hypothetical protein